MDASSKFLQLQQASPALPAAVLAIQTLVAIASESSAPTMMGLGKDLDAASAAILQVCQTRTPHDSTLPVASACTLCSRFAMREFAANASLLRSKLAKFAAGMTEAHDRIASLCEPFFRNDAQNVLVHGYSLSVAQILLVQKQAQKRITAYVTTAHPFDDGKRMLEALTSAGIYCIEVPDAAVYHVMDQIDFVVLGAEAVVENGGVVNRMGTAQVACVAHARGKPVYVAAESYKFCRAYPLRQSDISQLERNAKNATSNANGTSSSWNSDYMPPDMITLLVTDLGILTPSAVSDELIKLYL
jgi:translation initiation factor eIF-2B subunit alpha